MSAPETAPSFEISVVVPTFRRPELLARCLDALLAQDFPKDRYEILVCDDAASETTRSQVEQVALSAAVLVRYVHVGPRHGPAAARNCGWRAARSALIAFTDDDTIPEPDWLLQAVRAFEEHRVIAGWGTLVMPVSERPTDYERDAAALMQSEFVTANCFVRREALVAVGGFDERFTVAWREDSDLYFGLLRIASSVGREIAFVRGARVAHPIRHAPWGISLAQQRKSMFNALLYKKHPDLYRRKIQAMPPWHYYLMVGFALFAALAFLVGDLDAASFAFQAWAFLTLSFFFYRVIGSRPTPSHVLEMAVTSVAIPFLSVYWRIRGALTFRVLFF